MQSLYSSNHQKVNSVGYLIVALSVFLLYFLKLGSIGITDPGEGYYVEAAREMVESGDYITPHLNYQIYFSKPILTFWLMAGSYLCLGVNEVAARLPFSILMMLLCLGTYYVSSRALNFRAGLFAALVTCTSPLMLAFVKFSPIDITFAFFLNLTLFAFFLTCLLGDRRFWSLFWIGLSLALLTKGPAALVFSAIGIGLFLVIERASWKTNWERLKNLRPIYGVLIFSALSLSWYAAVHRATHGLFTKVFFLYENYARFSGHTNLAHNSPFHYFRVISYGFFPWILLLPAAFMEVSQARVQASLSRSYLALMSCYAIAVFMFFSFSKTQLDTYILPVIAPLSVLVGCYLDRVLALASRQFSDTFARGGTKWLNWFAWLISALFFLTGPALVYAAAVPLEGDLPFVPCLAVALILMAGAFVQALLLKSRQLALSVYSIFLLLIFSAVFITNFTFSYLDQTGQRQLRDLCCAVAQPGDRFALFRSFKPSLMFYLKRPVDSFFHPSQLIVADRKALPFRQFVVVHEHVMSYLQLPDGVTLLPVSEKGGYHLFLLTKGKLDQVETLEAIFGNEEAFQRSIMGQSDWGPLTVPYGGGNAHFWQPK